MNSKIPTAGIILAAGLSTRFGRPKPLADLNGKPLIAWVVEACLNSRLDKIVVVLGDHAAPIASVLTKKYIDPRISTIINPHYRKGMSSSLQTGLTSVMQTFPAVMFLLGDQPLVSSGLIDRLLGRFWESEKDLCVPVHKGRRGNPTLFSRRFYRQLLKLSGDIGAREIIRTSPDAALWVEVDDPLPFFDIDTKADLKTLCTILKKRNEPIGCRSDIQSGELNLPAARLLTEGCWGSTDVRDSDEESKNGRVFTRHRRTGAVETRIMYPSDRLMEKEELKKTILDYLQRHHTLSLATERAGIPHAATVFYVSIGFDLYFLSSPTSRHSENLSHNPCVSATINEGYDKWQMIKGIQLEGHAEDVGGILENSRIAGAFVKKYPDVADFLFSPGKLGRIIAQKVARVRFYRIKPARIFFINNAIDFGNREELTLPD